jgi:2-polyprenyl-3-methyl-5-hydroxy-6-metoxy-1,4-benzoquinol methylase
MKINETTLNFWKYEDTINFLKIKDFIKPDINVLEFGVGFGYTLKGFYEHGMNVYGVDVSRIALRCVEGFCEKTYTVDEIDKLPTEYFDLIIYYNVVQHIPTPILIEEFKNSIRSLKSNGLMSIQFVSTPNIEDLGSDKISNTGESFFRSKTHLEKLINSLGGTCELVYDSIRFYSPYWLKTSNDSGYGKIEYSSDFVTIPLPFDAKSCPVKHNITGNHVFHVKKILNNV